MTITFATKQMRLSAKDPDALIPRIQQTINAMEDGVTVVPKESAPAPAPKDDRRPRKRRSFGVCCRVLFCSWPVKFWST